MREHYEAENEALELLRNAAKIGRFKERLTEFVPSTSARRRKFARQGRRNDHCPCGRGRSTKNVIGQ